MEKSEKLLPDNWTKKRKDVLAWTYQLTNDPHYLGVDSHIEAINKPGNRNNSKTFVRFIDSNPKITSIELRSQIGVETKFKDLQPEDGKFSVLDNNYHLGTFYIVINNPTKTVANIEVYFEEEFL